MYNLKLIDNGSVSESAFGGHTVGRGESGSGAAAYVKKKNKKQKTPATCTLTGRKRRVPATATTWQHCRTAFAAPPPTLPPPCNSYFVSSLGPPGANVCEIENPMTITLTR